MAADEVQSMTEAVPIELSHRPGVGSAVLRLDALSLFAILFASHLLFEAISAPGELSFRHSALVPFTARIMLIGIALASLARPRSLAVLIGMMAARLIVYAIHAPVASNNATISAFAAVALVGSSLYLAIVDRKLERERLYRTFAPMARDLLLIMYSYGIFHKINSDFLNPNVSCAVAIYKPVVHAFGLQDWLFGQYGAIYSTFVVETLAIFCLLSRRWKFYGLAIGIPFHLIIGFSGYRFYMEFSMICLSLYTLFLPSEYFVRVNQALRRLPTAARTALLALPATLFALTLAGGQIAISRHFWPYHAMPVFALVGGTFYLSVLYFCPRSWAAEDTPAFRFTSPIFAVLSLLFLVNGISPYIGFKTESSITMFSNLRTEGGRTNHLLFSSLPYLFSYQQNLVTIRSSNAAALQDYIGPNRQMVEYELHRILANAPDTKVQFSKDGQSFDHVDPADNQYLATNWLLRQLLIFKPVDWTEPKPCTH
jgi:hypothetical protein